MEDDDKQTFLEVYRQNREELKQLPLVAKMLPLTEKSVKKLEVKKLQDLNDKRDFDLELQQKSIYKSIALLRANVKQLAEHLDQEVLDDTIITQSLKVVQQSFELFRAQNIDNFDHMNAAQELLQREIDALTEGISGLAEPKTGVMASDDEFEEIEEEDTERVEEPQQQQPVNPTERVIQLDIKIKQLGGAKGKWLQSDHKQFVKLYTRARGNEEKVVKDCIEVLGMNNIQVLQHLEHYEKYLQYQNEKKLLAAEFRRAKEQKLQQQRLAKQAQEKRLLEEKKKKQADQAAERLRQKEKILQYREKRLSEEKKVDVEKVEKLKQEADAKQAKRASSVAKTKKKLEDYNSFKVEQQKKMEELQKQVTAKAAAMKGTKNSFTGKPPKPLK